MAAACHTEERMDVDSFTARNYQEELFQKAKNANIIVPLGTGTGKTYIAVLLIKHYAHKLRPRVDDGGKRAFFLVNTVALVPQQADQIRAATDLKVAELSGVQYHPAVWDIAQWNALVATTHVFVMTAEIFKNILAHAYWSMRQTALIVIDECHHASDTETKAPFTLIINHYKEWRSKCGNENIDDVPRLLGLTASIVNKRIEPRQLPERMTRLEEAMCCKIETTSHLIELAAHGARPTIRGVIWHDDRRHLEERATLERLMEIDERIKPLLKPVLKTTNFLGVFDQLGLWAAWKTMGFAESELERAIRERTLQFTTAADEEEELAKAHLKKLRDGREYLGFYCTSLTCEEELLRLTTYRVEMLMGAIQYSFKELQQNVDGNAEEFSGIVFVKQRIVALVLKELLVKFIELARDKYGWLSVDYVVGPASSDSLFTSAAIDASDALSSHNRLKQVLTRFRKKELNLLTSTSVLEEGIDVPHCNCIIRFDETISFRSFVQSKGRARKRDSKFFLFGNKSRAELCVDLNRFKTLEEALLKTFRERSTSPEDNSDVNEADRLIAPYCGRQLPGGEAPCIPATSAISLVNNYCNQLPSDRFTLLGPKVEYEPIQSGDDAKLPPHYTASITLPINSPIKETIKGQRVFHSKRLAAMSVAVEVCRLLDEKGELDDHLRPWGKRRLGSDAETLPPGKSPIGSHRRKHCYNRKTADFFSGCGLLSDTSIGSSVALQLAHINISHVLPPSSGRRLCATLFSPSPEVSFGLLTLNKLQSPVPAFDLFLSQQQIRVTVVASGEMRCSQAQFEVARKFSRFLFETVFNCGRAPDGVQAAPAAENVDSTMLLCIVRKNVVEWSSMDDIATSFSRRPTDAERQSAYFSAERFPIGSIVWPWYRGTRRAKFYRVAKIMHELRPPSEFGDGECATFNEYYGAKYDALRIFDQEQPLLYCKDVNQWATMLCPLTTGNKNAETASRENALTDEEALVYDGRQHTFLVPELLNVHPLFSEVWDQLVCLPSALYRLNQLLLANELLSRIRRADNERLTEEPTADLILSALTTRGAQDAFNLERLETLGDSILKYAVTVALFFRYLDEHEGYLTQRRSAAICNANLFKRGEQLLLPALMSAKKFEPKQSGWVPPGYTMSLVGDSDRSKEEAAIEEGLPVEEDMEDESEETVSAAAALGPPLRFDEQIVSEKSVADSVEAVIGAYSMQGVEPALDVLRWIGIDDVDVLANDDYKRSYSPLLKVVADPEAELEKLFYANNFAQVEKNIGYTFTNKALLVQAMSHASSVHRLTDCYQRLEFLGDAVLDYLVTRHLFADKSAFSPGQLTELRSKLVNNKAFARLAYLLDTCNPLRRAVKLFVDRCNSEADANLEASNHDETNLVNEMDCSDDALPATIDIMPKVLGDLFESVAGAVFLDVGCSLDRTWEVFSHVMEGQLKNVVCRMAHEQQNGRQKPKLRLESARSTSGAAPTSTDRSTD